MITIDIDIVAGSDDVTQLTALNAASGIINLSGYSLTGNARFRYDNNGRILSFTPTSPTPESGIVNVNLLSAVTSGLPVGAYYYGIDAWSGTTRETLFQGFLNVGPNVFFVIDSGVYS